VCPPSRDGEARPYLEKAPEGKRERERERESPRREGTPKVGGGDAVLDVGRARRLRGGSARRKLLVPW